MVYLLLFFEVLVHVPGLGQGVLVLDIGNQFAFTVACSLNGLDSNLQAKMFIYLLTYAVNNDNILYFKLSIINILILLKASYILFMSLIEKTQIALPDIEFSGVVNRA